MATLRDLESRISALDRELANLRADLRNFKNEKRETSTPVSNNGNDLDSVIVADGSTISHKLKHIFDQLVTRDLELENIDLKGSGPPPQIHISNDTTAQGTYIMNLGAATYYVSGATWDGTNWIAKNTVAAMMTADGTGGFTFFANTGLSVGSSFSWTQRFKVANTGNLTIEGTATKFNGLTASKPLKLNSSKEVISSAIDLTTDVTNVLPTANGGAAGISTIIAFVYGVVGNLTTLNYKDHAGTNQSTAVVTSLTVSSRVTGVTNGLLSS